MHINNQFDLGDIVYLKTEVEQLPHIIVGIQVCADGGLIYKCSQGTDVDWHYEVEMTEEINVSLKTNY